MVIEGLGDRPRSKAPHTDATPRNRRMTANINPPTLGVCPDGLLAIGEFQMRLLLAGVGVLALTLSSGAASAQYMIVPNGPNGSIMLLPGAGQTSGYGNSVNPG